MEFPYLEKHVSGDEDGETVGWRWHVDADHSVWCGEISRTTFEELDVEHQEALGNDYGWFLMLYGKRQSVMLGRALDEYQGCDLAQTIALGLRASPVMIAQLLQDVPDFQTGLPVATEGQVRGIKRASPSSSVSPVGEEEEED